MKILTHSQIPKYAFIGTSSSRKTTLTYKTCGFLKEHGIRADGILQQDRRLPFPKELLETHAEAQYWFLTNMMTAENYMALQQGVDCIVSDRSVVDFFAYAETQWPSQMADWKYFVLRWASTYRALFYLKPQAYDDDGVRPSDEFRLRVDKTLQKLIQALPNVITVEDRDEVMRYIAIDTKRLIFGSVAEQMTLTGSWYKGTEKPGSDFDFIMLDSYWESIPKSVRAKFEQIPHEEYVTKHNDVGLCRLFRSRELNIDVQCQDTEKNLKTRLAANTAELIATRIQRKN